ncbi:putative disease resistance protein RGA3 [Chenopodium quinoa]|uniref:putative disease resistance protein RGA3 n=1 Tax=Chenopodium quinoa TaxID=63459 RepID=UPI000B798941|nr:putative disease resistance protein RGA3 [Chenopodium quinoa]
MKYSLFGNLPDSVGKLLHLRFLNLSQNQILVSLSDSITELHNLQTLVLSNCYNLRELPKDFSKLVKLRYLDLRNCGKLTRMPSGMDKLTSLRVLPFFVMGKCTEKQCDEELKNLKALTNIKGNVYVEIGRNYRRVEGMKIENSDMKFKCTKHLIELKIRFDSRCVDYDGVLEILEPPSNLKGFILDNYQGKNIPRWGGAECNWTISFPHLVNIELISCTNLKVLPSLSTLPYLKSLLLRGLTELEYIENRNNNNTSSAGEILTAFFPSLESLKIIILPKLKGWWREDNDVNLPTFPRLAELEIQLCKSLMSIPPCPSLQVLTLCANNKTLPSNVRISLHDARRLRSLAIDDVDYLNSIFCNDQLSISEDIPWKSLNQSLISLKFLFLRDRAMPVSANGVQYLTSLQTLKFSLCNYMKALPDWISNLSSLQSMSIKNCNALESLPESMKKLTSLQRLRIKYCSDLEERCKEPNGEDCPKIQHIPHVHIGLKTPMAELGISIAQKLIEVTGSAVFKEICGIWGYKSQLEELNKTISTVKNVLLCADSKQELLDHERDYIEDLKAAVYDADDLFDEFLTLAELKQLRPLSKSGKLFAKVCSFFSSKNQVGQAYRMSRQVKDIKKQLEVIVTNHQKFGFSIDYKPIVRRREETCSYLDAKAINHIIGREDDKKAIIDMLLSPNNNDHEDDCFVTVVGVGGLGKTTLAQLVFNDIEVVKEFPDPKLRLWVCVADQDGEMFDVKLILCKILELVSNIKPSSTSTLESLQRQFKQQLMGKKFLLVLDDVWTEDQIKWHKLRNFLMFGQGGSRIVVTTRSHMTADIIGGKNIYKLEGLSRENSWRLFEITAFGKGPKHINHLELAEIGEKIVERCYDIPLAIKVVGSLLYGQGISKWRSLKERSLTGIDNGDNEIMSILKLSYHNLGFSLKSCFRYCALFPKDTKIEKEMLISLWIAQDYIVPFDRGQSIEDAAEEHFLILLRRCFFQDVVRDKYGDVVSIKIHDLMHDVAQEVGLEEISVVSSTTNNLGDRTRHLQYVSDTDTCSESFFFKGNIRSFICSQGIKELPKDTQIDNWMCLRVLDLKYSSFESLPDSIDKLLRVRYLNLSLNLNLKTLPDSITELHNLQTLILRCCFEIRELPRNFSKLIKLRHLDLGGCFKLTSMPSGMEKLTSLRVLPFFVVGKGIEKQCVGELEDLRSLTNIRGRINIEIGENYRNVKDTIDCLKSTQHLTEVIIEFDDNCVDHQVHMEKLLPHSNLKGFMLRKYMGTTIPRWGRAEDSWAVILPHLVTIELQFCSNLEQIPLLSKLPYLKSLVLINLSKLEYMESTNSNTIRDEEELTTFFPSLESLEITSLRSLKGWWCGAQLIANGDHHILKRRLKFSRLSKLKINGCHSLMSFPPCPSLEDLELCFSNESLLFKVNRRDEDNEAVGILWDDVRTLKRLVIDKLGYLKSIIGMVEDDIPWKSLNQSLRSLKIMFLKDRFMPTSTNGLQYLTSLQTLQLSYCYTLIALPDWISCLSSLQSLSITDCPSLKSLPESMRRLSSLQSLEITRCPCLEQRCAGPNGEDQPKIKHIPHVKIGES